MNRSDGTEYDYPAFQIFNIPLTESEQFLYTRSGIVELHLPGSVKKFLLTEGEWIGLPEKSTVPEPFIIGYSVTESRVIVTDSVPPETTNHHIPNLFPLTPKIQFAPDLLNGLFTFLKILIWHHRDLPKSPVSRHLIRMECAKFQITSDFTMKLFTHLMVQSQFLRPLGESTFAIDRVELLSEILSILRTMLNVEIYDPWYLNQMQFQMTRLLLLLQMNSIAGEFAISEEELMELLSLLPFSTGDMKKMVKEWQQQKVVQVIHEESDSYDEEAGYLIRFSALQNFWTSMQKNQEAVYELIRLYQLIQSMITAPSADV